MHGHEDDGGAGTADDATEPDLDLVEYVVITVPEPASAAGVATALRQLVQSRQIRILDIVGVRTGLGGLVTAVEPELVSGLEALDDVDGEVGGLRARTTSPSRAAPSTPVRPR